ncbi:hypothetical protein VTJ83DRAFT_5911 [Remersonia thermophila]|uniref:Uncharacterized protein n=1 Tax=Remersonia thermophila TaxID=72144 RepID=A0ABR4D868_9PEZI
MSLSPLQSRLVASLVASCLLLLLYLFLFPPQFALAAELQDPPSPAIFDAADFAADFSPRAAAAAAAAAAAGPAYDPGFSLFDRSITGRAPDGPTSLADNEPMAMNINPGATHHFVFSWSGVSGRDAEEGRLELRSHGHHHHNVSQERSAGAGAAAGSEVTDDSPGQQSLAARQTARMIWISATTCQHPQQADPSKTTAPPPQLTLYISKTPANQSPGPGADRGTQDAVVFEEGAAWYKFTTDSEVYLGVHAPDLPEGTKGGFSFLIAASTDEYYYSYEGDTVDDLYLVDSDSQGAILMTRDLMDSPDPVKEQQIMGTQPYSLFAHNAADPAINGVRRSYCGLKTYAHMAITTDGRSSEMVKTIVTKRGKTNMPKQQFFFTGLNASSEYVAILARGTRSAGDLAKRQAQGERGSLVFRETTFRTKSDHGNCAIIVDLAFCDQVAYAVPSNPNFGNSTKLAQFYDDYAATMYANFNKSLAQIACEAPPSQRYSLSRNCTDCAAAYKDWLCSVAIPRCEDFDNQAGYLQPRAVFQPFPDGSTLTPEELSAANVRNTTLFTASRNPLIDEVVKPGPYKELLPCDDVCYKLVQSCPAAMGFSCPVPGDIGFKGNYGQHTPGGGLTCNFPGSAHLRSGSGRMASGGMRRWGLVGWAAVMGLWVM